MIDDSENLSQLDDFPTEILYFIFSFLPAKKLIKCREVCVRWKEIIDELFKSEVVWWRYCENDFNSVISVARRKARPGVSSYDLYKSLCLWPQLELANEEIDEFASASSVQDEILGFEIVSDGIIGVRTKGGIVYYNLETLQQANRSTIHGQYIKYVETDDTLILLNSLLHLFIVRTITHNPHYKAKMYFDNVKLFMLLDSKVYIVNLNEEIYICDLKSENLDTKFLQQSIENVLCLGHINNELYILTYDRKIYKVDSNSYFCICSVDAARNLLDVLYRYNFLERMEWRTYYHWLFVLNLSYYLPDGPMRSMAIVRRYGDVYFVGTDWGLLRIYYAPYTNDEFDLYYSEPVKQFNFSERFDCPVLTRSSILQIDVSETQNGHTVLVGMPKKIAVINLKHNFKTTTSLAVLPYQDTQEALKTSTCD